MIIALRGRWPSNLQSIPDEAQDDFQLLCEYLDRRLGDKHMPSLHRTEFKNRRQSVAETLQEFSIDLSRIVRLAFTTAPEDVLETLAVHAFVDGV